MNAHPRGAVPGRQGISIGWLWLVSSVSCVRKGGSAPPWKAPLKGFRCATHPPPNLSFWLSCHQLCFRLPSAKDVFFTQLINTFGDVKSPVASTLFVLDSQIFLFMTATLRFQCSDGVTVTTGCNICLSASSRRSALGIRYQCSTCEK